ncbi:MAG: hypothetical protein FWF34_02170 [Alphaproteobacteria bacterium]|nr:hypothetical protein [Alphaproteobacteria bacterium]MCL2890038.1 hypothetical protein [Alphaproteobacteria bacterium]
MKNTPNPNTAECPRREASTGKIKISNDAIISLSVFIASDFARNTCRDGNHTDCQRPGYKDFCWNTFQAEFSRQK